MTKSELKSIIMECLQEEGVLNEEVEDEMVIESAIVSLDESVFVSKQGKDIKDRIKDIVYENTTRLTTMENLKRYFFGGTNAIKVSEAEKVTKGVEGLFDVCHATKIFSYRTAANDSINYKYFTAIKGNYMYTFTINFNPASSKIIGFTFKETILDSKAFRLSNPKDVISFIIKNCDPDHVLQINKKGFASYKIGREGYSANEQNEKLYSAVAKKFPGVCVFDDVYGKVKFSLKDRI